jgi:hypothetical protein
MNHNPTAASSKKSALELSVSAGENLQPPSKKTFDPATMDKLLQDWGAYLPLRAKIIRLFHQKTSRQSAE